MDVFCDMVEYLTQPDVQDVLTRLAQLVGAVVGLKWTGRGVWYLAAAAWCLALVAVGRPARWVWRHVKTAPTPEEMQQRVLVRSLEGMLDAGASYDAASGLLLAQGATDRDTLSVQMAVAMGDVLAPPMLSAVHLYGQPVTVESLGHAGWRHFERCVRAAVSRELGRQRAARDAAEARRREQARDLLLASLAAGRKVERPV